MTKRKYWLIKGLALGCTSALIFSATAAAQALKTNIPDSPLNNAGKINYANCVMKHTAEAYLKKEGAFLDSYMVVTGCNCIAYANQIGELQKACAQVRNPNSISREKAREYGLTKF